jgi:membrane protein implicated in regulation of membrane protease activity
MVARMRTWMHPHIGTRWSQGAVLIAALAVGAVTAGGATQLAFATLLLFALLVTWALWPLRELRR